MKCDGEASLLHLWLLGGQPLTRNTLEPFGIAAVCLQRVFKFMINFLVLTVSRRQVLCYRGHREMRTGQQGWGAPWRPHTKTIPGDLGSCRSVSICGDRRLLRVGVLPWDVGSVAVLVPDSGSCPGHNLCRHAVSPHCPQPIGAAPRQGVACDGIHGALSRPGGLVSGCPPGWSALGPPASFSGLSERQPGLERWCPWC